MAKVSLIVSIHNPGKYLIPMVDSLIYQTFKDIEIFLIDDGSTDETREILNNYKTRDERINVIFREKKENEKFGQKHSADLGRSLAKGEYLMMLDHDDILPYDAVEKLYAHTNNGTIDVVQGREISVDTEGKITFKTPEFFSKPTIISDLENLSEDLLALHLLYMPISLWACLIRNDFQKDIELVDCIFNDTDYIWRLKLKAKTFCYIPYLVYIHNIYSDSVSGNNNTNKYYSSLFRIFELLEDFVMKNTDVSLIKKLFYIYKFISLYYFSNRISSNIKTIYFKKVCESIQNDIDISPFFFIFTTDPNMQIYYLLARQYKSEELI